MWDCTTYSALTMQFLVAFVTLYSIKHVLWLFLLQSCSFYKRNFFLVRQTAYKRTAKRALIHITLNLIVYLPRCFFLCSPFSFLLEIQIGKKKIHKVIHTLKWQQKILWICPQLWTCGFSHSINLISVYLNLDVPVL